MKHLAQKNWITPTKKCFLRKTQKTLSRAFLTSLILSFCLITQPAAANRYNDIRDIPFIEMMVTMMKFMNSMMGVGDDDNYFPGLNTFPYSPAFMPGMNNFNNGLGGFNNLPMSPAGFNALPLNSMSTAANSWQDSFETGQDSGNTNSRSNNFWDPANSAQKTVSINHQSINGIWQALSGDVIAIYKNNRFIWSDGNARNLAGQLAIKGNYLIAYIPASKTTLKFQFFMEPGQFIVRDQSSRVYTFKRIH